MSKTTKAYSTIEDEEFAEFADSMEEASKDCYRFVEDDAKFIDKKPKIGSKFKR